MGMSSLESAHAARKAQSPEGVNGREDWLAADEWGRLRPWAYEEILFGSTEERARAEELAAVVGELADRAHGARGPARDARPPPHTDR